MNALQGTGKAEAKIGLAGAIEGMFTPEKPGFASVGILSAGGRWKDYLDFLEKLC